MDLYETLALLCGAAGLDLRRRDRMLVSQDVTEVLLLETEATAGIELTMIAT